MKINFTNRQFAKLIRLVYLGNWMVNAIRDPNEVEKDYDDLESHVLSHCKDFGMPELTEEETGIAYPSRKLEEDKEILRFMDEYNEDNFWEELTYRLGNRDFHRHYGPAKIKVMTNWIDRAGKRDPFVEKYEDEFGKNGLDRLEISNNRMSL
jgi:hypothetical protein